MKKIILGFISSILILLLLTSCSEDQINRIKNYVVDQEIKQNIDPAEVEEFRSKFSEPVVEISSVTEIKNGNLYHLFAINVAGNYSPNVYYSNSKGELIVPEFRLNGIFYPFCGASLEINENCKTINLSSFEIKEYNQDELNNLLGNSYTSALKKKKSGDFKSRYIYAINDFISSNSAAKNSVIGEMTLNTETRTLMNRKELRDWNEKIRKERGEFATLDVKQYYFDYSTEKYHIINRFDNLFAPDAAIIAENIGDSYISDKWYWFYIYTNFGNSVPENENITQIVEKNKIKFVGRFILEPESFTIYDNLIFWREFNPVTNQLDYYLYVV